MFYLHSTCIFGADTKMRRYMNLKLLKKYQKVSYQFDFIQRELRLVNPSTSDIIVYLRTPTTNSSFYSVSQRPLQSL